MRHNIRRLTMWLLLPLIFLSACMDVSPPTAQEEDLGTLLHSVRLPYSIALYGVNNVDSLGLEGVLVDGRVVPIEPSEIQWTVRPLTSALTVDSVGRLRVQAHSSLKYTIIAAYTVGQITRSDTATVYLTPETYDIRTFKIVALDSARGGPTLAAAFFGIDIPEVRVDIFDVNGDTIQGAPEKSSMLVSSFVDSATGALVPVNNLISVYNSNIIRLSNINLPERQYWFSVSSHLYGKLFKDSILYQSMPPASLEFIVTKASNGLSIDQQYIVKNIQPCAWMVVANSTNDPIAWKLSKPVAERECGGVLPALDGGVVLPQSFGIVTSMGYNPGQDITWSIFPANQPESSVSGTVHIKDPHSN